MPSTKNKFDPLNTKIPENFYSRLGLIVTYFSRIDYISDHIIWALLEIDFQQGRYITPSMNSSNRWSLMKNLLQHSDYKDIYNYIKKINKPVRDLYEERRNFAHGAWYRDSENNNITCTSAAFKTGLPDKIKTFSYTTDELDELISTLSYVINTLYDAQYEIEQKLNSNKSAP